MVPVGTETSKPTSACTCFLGATCAGVKLDNAGAQPAASSAVVASRSLSPDKPLTIHG